MISAIDPSSSLTLYLCLNKILLSTFVRNDYRIFAINTDIELSLPIFRINLKDEATIDNSLKPDVYVINSDETVMEHFVHLFYNEIFFNPRAQYILFGSSISPKMSTFLASEFILNVIFVDTTSWKIFTYYPYKNRMLRVTDNRWKEITTCNSVISSDEKPINYFEKKTPKVWTNSSVTVGMMIYPPYDICTDCDKRGSDVDLWDHVLAHMNITGVYMLDNYAGDDIIDIGEKHILNKTYDIYLCELTSLYTDPVYPYVYIYLYWVVPSPEELPRWKYIFHLSTTEVWIYWIGSLIVIIIFWGFIDNHSLEASYIWQKCSMIMKLSIEQPISIELSYVSQSIMVILVLFFTFIMSAIFKSGFPFLLSGFNFEKPIETPQDIMDHNLTLGLDSYAYELGISYFSQNDEMLDYFNSHVKYCDVSGDCYDQIIAERDMATIMEEESLNFRQKNNRDSMDRSLVRKLMPEVIREQLGSHLIKGHPISEDVNRYFLFFDQHGFKKRIMSYYFEIEPVQMFFQIKSLTLEFIVFPLLIFGFGISVALVVFYVESTTPVGKPLTVKQSENVTS